MPPPRQVDVVLEGKPGFAAHYQLSYIPSLGFYFSCEEIYIEFRLCGGEMIFWSQVVSSVWKDEEQTFGRKLFCQ